MFRHKGKPSAQTAAEEEKSNSKADVKISQPPVVAAKSVKDASPEALRELLEKNLKWSQIIYEQNRRLNRKLIWGAVGSWLRLLVIVVPLVLAILYLPSVVRDISGRFNFLIGNESAVKGDSNTSVEQLMDLLHLNAAQKEQVKAMLK